MDKGPEVRASQKRRRYRGTGTQHEETGEAGKTTVWASVAPGGSWD